MTADPITVLRAAAALCHMCANPQKWQPAVSDEGDYGHLPVGRFAGDARWCESNLLWSEFEGEVTPEAMKA